MLIIKLSYNDKSKYNDIDSVELYCYYSKYFRLHNLIITIGTEHFQIGFDRLHIPL